MLDSCWSVDRVFVLFLYFLPPGLGRDWCRSVLALTSGWITVFVSSGLSVAGFTFNQPSLIQAGIVSSFTRLDPIERGGVLTVRTAIFTGF